MMLTIDRRSRFNRVCRSLVAVGCVAVLASGDGVFLAQDGPASAAPSPAAVPETAPTVPPDQLDSLVAPIALYPDSLLAQTLVASTYPLEIVQLQQWLVKNKDLKDKALADAVAKQPWDSSIQSMAAVPDVVKRLADDIQWTTELGNAFLAQQSDVMDAVQRMRQKAKGTGALESNEQQNVEVKVVEQKTVIVVESANPQVIYVPSYSPTIVYGPPVYPYPPIYYPVYPPGAAFVTFSMGIMIGAAFWGGSCCGCGWGHSNNVNINVNNNFNRVNHHGGGGNGNWQHSPQHRGGAPYGDRATANKYGGGARGDAPSAGNRASSPSAGGRPSSGANQIGSRNIPSGGGSKAGGFSGGAGGGYSGSSARASSSRGASSMGSRPRGGGGGARRR